MSLAEQLPQDWREALGEAVRAPAFLELEAFLKEERRAHRIYPSPEDLFSAFRLTPLRQVRVVILGQDPYHGPGQAHGLAFSVQKGIPLPPSLRNIFKELGSDLPGPLPSHGCLEGWAKQGVLLLNAVLTVQEGAAHSHAHRGWEPFTDAALCAAAAQPRPMGFVLWGGWAQRKKCLLEGSRHLILEAPHPSPLSSHRGFFGSRPFSQLNRFLESQGQRPIDWNAL